MQSQLETIEDEAARQDKQMGVHGLVDDDSPARKKDPDYHAIMPINDYPQKLRWILTNKETMSQLIEATGASVTDKGIFYEHGEEPPLDGQPKLHLLIESSDEFRVEQAVREIKRLLIEASAEAMQAKVRRPNQTAGRNSVLLQVC